ncbi:MAG: ATP-grasp domain-containing protein [Halomonadaceae bacterium]|nr:MAG: ATP-grasp domain-containing protein [Halomonadaceae bacterium]
MGKQNVFVVGLDAFNQALLEQLRGAERLTFRPLLDINSVVHTRDYDIPQLLQQARGQLDAFPGTIDAIVGYWDFPTSTILPVLRQQYQLPGPSLESVLRCEHKYWARLEQQQVAPQETPAFAPVNPFTGDQQPPPLPFPFWIKPVRAHSSQLGYRVNTMDDYHHALGCIRDGIHMFAVPFNTLLAKAQLPEEIIRIDGWHCIAEEIISQGRQCTIEGYMLNGEVTIYGVVDSLREGVAHSSFSRYQYPSSLPQGVQDTMMNDAQRFLQQVGFDNSPFNIEFYYHDDREQLWMLEVNTRCSKSHSPLFAMVDGASNLQAMVDVALGHPPDFPPQGGPCQVAGKFMLRETQDALVERVPTLTEVHRLEANMQHCLIQIEPLQGQRLSEMLHQDSYSYEVATLFIGGESAEDIEAKAESIKQQLHFRFSP